MRYIFNPITEELEAPDNPSPLYENLGKKFKLTESVLPYDSDHPTPIRKNLGQTLLAKNDNIYPWG